MKQSPFRCRDGDPECLGGFMQRALLQVIKFDDLPECWSQLCDCVSQGCLLLGSCANLLWIWHRVAQYDRVCGVFHLNFPRYAILADFISAALIAMRVSHVENLALSSNFL